MNYKRTATIGVVGGALAVWLAAAGTSDVRVAPTVIKKTRAELSGAELASEITKLHERLRPTIAPRQEGRNLFQFNAARAAVAAPRRADPPEADAVPALPPPPSLKLSGIAEDRGTDGPVRTAIISTGGELFLAKEGEMVTPRFKVSRISADVVELIDLTTNEPVRLALR